MPPTAISVTWVPTRARSRRSTSSERALSGAPDRPPAPSAATSAAGVARPVRAIVVLVAMMPSSAELEREVGDRVDVVVGEVGRDLDEQRDPAQRRGEVAGGADGDEQRAQLVDGLEVAQARACSAS